MAAAKVVARVIRRMTVVLRARVRMAVRGVVERLRCGARLVVARVIRRMTVAKAAAKTAKVVAIKDNVGGV